METVALVLDQDRFSRYLSRYVDRNLIGREDDSFLRISVNRQKAECKTINFGQPTEFRLTDDTCLFES